jgi:hypothetical protein
MTESMLSAGKVADGQRPRAVKEAADRPPAISRGHGLIHQSGAVAVVAGEIITTSVKSKKASTEVTSTEVSGPARLLLYARNSASGGIPRAARPGPGRPHAPCAPLPP